MLVSSAALYSLVLLKSGLVFLMFPCDLWDLERFTLIFLMGAASSPYAIGKQASLKTGIGGKIPLNIRLFVNCFCMANEKLPSTIMFLSCHYSFV